MENQKFEIIPNHAVNEMLKIEIDTQIATAKMYPRELKQSIARCMDYATISQEVAESCVYALPRGGKVIEGPSVRLAEIVASSFGNIRSGARIIHNDGKSITAQGICHDLETNNSVTVEVKRKITDKNGVTYNEDLQILTGNAACAIAFRNAVFKVIPAAIVEDVMNKVKQLAKGDTATLNARITAAVNWFNSKGIESKTICDFFSIKTIHEINLEMLTQLSGFKTAVVSEGAKIEDIFVIKKEKTVAEKKTEMKDKKSNEGNAAAPGKLL